MNEKMMRESKAVEFKRELSESFKYAALAFVNTDGGKIYIGINDDGSVRGVEDPDGTMLKVTNALRDSISPDVTMFTECDHEFIDGKPVIVVTVHRGTSRPYYLKAKGIRPDGVYVRQGASSVPASESAILAMIKESSNDRFEDERSLIQELTFKCTKDFFKQKSIAFGDVQKRSLNLIGKDGTYTNLAWLLSDQCTSSINLAIFEGSQKIVFQDRVDLSGSVLKQLEEAFEFIQKSNRNRAEIEGLYRVERRDYPPEAIREALLNTVVHRDYSSNVPTLISIFDDRIEMLNSGGLVRGVEFEDIMMGVSSQRNPNLANVFYRLHLVESYGTGIFKIKNSYRQQSIQPEIQVSPHAFKVTLPNVNYGKTTVGNEIVTSPVTEDNKKSRILDFIGQKGLVVRKDVDELLKLSQPSTNRLLREMLEEGLIEKVGEGRKTQYKKAQR